MYQFCVFVFLMGDDDDDDGKKKDTFVLAKTRYQMSKDTTYICHHQPAPNRTQILNGIHRKFTFTNTSSSSRISEQI